MSSRCAASSSTVCGGSAGACARTSDFQSWRRPMVCSSGELDAGHLAERRDQARPVGPLLAEHAAPGLGDAVVAAPALPGLLDPPPLDPPALLEAVERGVERGERKAQAAAAAGLDQLADLVAVVALVLDDG